MNTILDFFLHLDKHLGAVISEYGGWTYGILFAIIYAETGFVVTPFLPGDSLLFIAGTFAATGALNIWYLCPLLIAAALLGNTTNYWIGHKIGSRVFEEPRPRWAKKEYFDKTHAFYEKYGGKTIIIARFVPIVRTFAPFVAGVGKMTYLKFESYDLVGGTVWVLICCLAGYFFGNLPFVQNNFSVVILAIIAISIAPAAVEFIRHNLNNRKQSDGAA
ncbi:MAG: DedA family protein [candidate division Zixibacteria bacterium]|nr:DedA family protein [candidate division Zixibacteria bacterium]